jgi:hypothetical protein
VFLDGGSEIDLEAATRDRFVGRTTVPNGGGGDPDPGQTAFSDGKGRGGKLAA